MYKCAHYWVHFVDKCKKNVILFSKLFWRELYCRSVKFWNLVRGDLFGEGELFGRIRSCVHAYKYNFVLLQFHYEVEKLQTSLEALDKQVAKEEEAPSNEKNVKELSAAVEQLKDAQANMEVNKIRVFLK